MGTSERRSTAAAVSAAAAVVTLRRWVVVHFNVLPFHPHHLATTPTRSNASARDMQPISTSERASAPRGTTRRDATRPACRRSPRGRSPSCPWSRPASRRPRARRGRPRARSFASAAAAAAAPRRWADAANTPTTTHRNKQTNRGGRRRWGGKGVGSETATHAREGCELALRSGSRERGPDSSCWKKTARVERNQLMLKEMSAAAADSSLTETARGRWRRRCSPRRRR